MARKTLMGVEILSADGAAAAAGQCGVHVAYTCEHCGGSVSGEARVGQPLRCGCGGSHVAVSGSTLTHRGVSRLAVWDDYL